jgi:hypothetical protein
MKKYWYHFTFLILIICLNKSVQAQFADDVYDKYTSVGQLGLAVTNFGVLGNGWNKIDGPYSTFL